MRPDPEGARVARRPPDRQTNPTVPVAWSGRAGDRTWAPRRFPTGSSTLRAREVRLPTNPGEGPPARRTRTGPGRCHGPAPSAVLLLVQTPGPSPTKLARRISGRPALRRRPVRPGRPDCPGRSTTARPGAATRRASLPPPVGRRPPGSSLSRSSPASSGSLERPGPDARAPDRKTLGLRPGHIRTIRPCR